MIKQKALLLFASCIALLCVCGGGSDIGNPDIKGRICYLSGAPVINCEVVLGPEGGQPGKIDTIVIDGGFSIILKSMSFDTVKTGKNGEFVFVEIPPGRYSLLASRDNLMGMREVYHDRYGDLDVAIELNHPAKLVFDNYSQTMDTSSGAFIAGRISGTTIINNKDIQDKILFNAVPAGFVDVILYRVGIPNVIVSDLQLSPNESLIVQLNPKHSPDDWTYRRMTRRDPLGRPFILSSSPEKGATGIAANVNAGTNYDVEIQFSHAMDAKSINPALSVFSSDSSLLIDTLWWQGSNVLRISLCNNKIGGQCVDDSLYLKRGVTYYVVVDTLASTTLGVPSGWPDTISFTPVP